MPTWFLSDVHLSDSRPKLCARFFQLLEKALEHPPQAIYFLGDIFEYWLGPDLRPDFWARLTLLCDQLHQKNILLFFLPGNRDFLLDEKSAQILHWQLLPDIHAIEVEGRKLLLMHGDLLCTQDTLYQAYRKIAHHPFVKRLFLKLPIRYRLSIVQKLRNQPKRSSYKIDKTIVNASNALPYLRKHEASILIHGHVHYPATHLYSDNHHSYQHWIMPDWRDHEGHYLVLNHNHLSLNYL